MIDASDLTLSDEDNVDLDLYDNQIDKILQYLYKFQVGSQRTRCENSNCTNKLTFKHINYNFFAESQNSFNSFNRFKCKSCNAARKIDRFNFINETPFFIVESSEKRVVPLKDIKPELVINGERLNLYFHIWFFIFILLFFFFI